MDKKIKLLKINNEAKYMFGQYGLADWDIQISNARSPIAETYHTDKVIVYSKYFCYLADKPMFRSVTKHELAHALIGPGKGHGKEFEEAYAKIDNGSKYAGATTDIFLKKYFFECPICHTSGSINKKDKYYCIPCAKKGLDSQVNISKNEIKVVPW